MKNFKIGTRILIGFITLIVLIIVLGVFSYVQLSTLNSKTEEITSSWMPSTLYANQMNANIANFRSREYRHIVSKTDAEMDDVENRMAQVITDFEKNRKAYKKVITSKEEEDLYEEFMKEWNIYLGVHDELLVISRQNLLDSCRKIMVGKSKKHYCF